jgi:hypothetical protein
MRTALGLAAAIAAAAPAAPARADSADDAPRAADKGTIGLGIILGEPTGISAKLYLSDDRAIQAAAGSAFLGGGLELDADYLFHPYLVESRPSFVLPLYVGPGVRLIDYSDGRSTSYFAIGVRVVGGLLFDFKAVPLDAFVEAGPVLEYQFKDAGGAALKLHAGAGVRYYF